MRGILSPRALQSPKKLLQSEYGGNEATSHWVIEPKQGLTAELLLLLPFRLFLTVNLPLPPVLGGRASRRKLLPNM